MFSQGSIYCEKLSLVLLLKRKKILYYVDAACDFNESIENLADVFVKTFTALKGNVIFCKNEQEVSQKLTHLKLARDWKFVHCTEDVRSGHIEIKTLRF